MNFSFKSTIQLNNGVEIPRLGFGTWGLKKKKVYQAVLWALEAGYRLIDTAQIYGNEKRIGQAVKDSTVPREEIFITTKLWNKDQGFKKCLLAFEQSLKRLDLSYIDLYLIHWPIKGLRVETWKALERIYDDNKSRAIGVSNFRIHHLNEILENKKYIPSVNQIEFSPFLIEEELINFCKIENIKVEAYSPLTRAQKLDHPTIKTIAKKYEKNPAQILIRWALQHNVVEIPRSSNKDHIFENRDVYDFSLDDDDVLLLSELNENFHVSHDSTGIA